jgi:hypothetical protein
MKPAILGHTDVRIMEALATGFVVNTQHERRVIAALMRDGLVHYDESQASVGKGYRLTLAGAAALKQWIAVNGETR